MSDKKRYVSLLIGVLLLLAACSETEVSSDAEANDTNEKVTVEAEQQAEGTVNEDKSDNEQTETKKDTDGVWSTYENDRFGFRVTYPSKWDVVENSDGVELYSNDQDNVTAYAGYHLEEYAPDFSDYEEIQIPSGQTAYVRTDTTNPEFITYSLVVIEYGIEYHLEAEMSEAFYQEHESLLEQMTEGYEVYEGTESLVAQSIDDVSWSSYQNSRYGFEAIYPEHWPIGEESVNGDGTQLYIDGANELSAFASRYVPEYAPDLSAFKSIRTSSGDSAYLQVSDPSLGTVMFTMVLVKNDIQYNLAGMLSPIFYERNKNILDHMVSEFKIGEIEEIDWSTYRNTRFGYEVSYPSDWPIGEESDNGDGIYLYVDGDNEILAYASHYMEEYAPNLSTYNQQPLESGETAYIKYEQNDSQVTFDMLLIKESIEYHLSGDVTLEFYQENKRYIESMIKNYKLVDGEEN